MALPTNQVIPQQPLISNLDLLEAKIKNLEIENRLEQLRTKNDQATADLKRRTEEYRQKTAKDKKELEDSTKKIIWSSLGLLVLSLTTLAFAVRHYYWKR